jgi:hypothetical protein
VDGNTYTALNNPRVVVYTGASVITKTYAFPDLTVNTLKPEQTITLVPDSLTAGDFFQYLHGAFLIACRRGRKPSRNSLSLGLPRYCNFHPFLITLILVLP